MTTTDTGADTATDATTTDTTATNADTSTDTAAEIAKWKALAQKHEDRARSNAGAVKELETLKQQSMSDTDKAVAQARTEARAEALKEVGGRLAEAAIKVAAAGRNVDIDALLEGVDASRFLDADGEPNTKAIAAWVDRVAPAVEEDKTPLKRDLGVGVRGQQPTAIGDDNALLRDIKTALRM